MCVPHQSSNGKVTGYKLHIRMKLMPSAATKAPALCEHMRVLHGLLPSYIFSLQLKAAGIIYARKELPKNSMLHYCFQQT